MSLLSQASLVVVPSGYKEDKVYSVKPTDGSGDLTFTRASDGTRVNSQGLVERVPWNLLQQSNTFSTSPWSATNATLTSGQSGYDGSSNAWLLSKTGDFGRVEQSTTTSGLLTLSVYAKAGTLNWLSFENSGIVADTCFFNLANGVVGIKGAGVVSTSIESIGGGWHRCSAVFNGTIGTTRIQPSISDGVVNGTNGNIYIQDAQLNEGSTAKPYFPTTDRLNVPRLDYSVGCPSLLLEPQRTNLAKHSNDTTNAVYVYQNSSVSSGVTSPDGTANAYGIIVNTTSNTFHRWYQSIGALSGVYTTSVYVKNGTSKYFGIGMNANGSTGNNNIVVFNLSTGTIASNPYSVNATITSVGNGWYRCTHTFNYGTGGSNADLCVHNAGVLSNYTTSAFQVFDTPSVSTTLYVWGVQVEAGSYATSYIPTTSASVTRVADAASKTGISSLIGQTEGTLFVEVDTAVLGDVFAGVNRRFLSISDGTTDNRIFINQDRATDAIGVAVITSATIVAAISTASNQSGIKKIAVGYANNDFVMYVNGVQIGTDTSGSVPACSRVGVGSAETSSITANAACPVSQAVLFKTRLTNAELAALTTL